ncbi:MAG: glutathione S-transferase family protein, partial [Bradymonadaceae bacterium]
MGVMIDGEWLPDGSLDSGGDSDEFQRSPTEFHNWITADGEPGPTGEGGFPAEPNRYHLYGALNCPWCHRTTLVREVKELQSLVGTSTVYPLRDERGWVFGDEPR